ncbi:MAG: CpaF family protein [Bacillota bacterium]|nr:CpaF family protein [Bacillota bacterium]
MKTLQERLAARESQGPHGRYVEEARHALSGAGAVVERARRDPGSRRHLELAVAAAVAASNVAPTREKVAHVAEEVLGYGPLQALLVDPEITDVMVNGPGEIYVERQGRLEKTDLQFRDEKHLLEVARRIAGDAGRRLDASHPYVDARLPDGSRFHAILPPISLKGPCLTIRRFRQEFFTLEELAERGSLTPQALRILEEAVVQRQNILISGNTGSGKTTLLTALAARIAPEERVITIEDAAELRLPLPHAVALETRPAGVEGNHGVSLRELVRNALRMRPDRLLIGEMRGAEAFDVLQAWHTGHRGSFCTVHANGPEDALLRFTTLASLAPERPPFAVLKRQVKATVDLMVHLERTPQGRRQLAQICTWGNGKLRPLLLVDGDREYALKPMAKGAS